MISGERSTPSWSVQPQSDQGAGPQSAGAPMQVRRKGNAPRISPSPNAEIFAAGEKAQLELQKVFGANLRAARMEAGLKQSEVASITGLTQQYLSFIENGQANLTLRTMAILAEVVARDLLDLLKQIGEASHGPE